MTIFENTDYEYLIQVEVEAKTPNENKEAFSKDFVVVISAVIPGYDFTMEYPGKGQILETWSQLTETVDYLLLNMKEPADKLAALIDESEKNHPI